MTSPSWKWGNVRAADNPDEVQQTSTQCGLTTNLRQFHQTEKKSVASFFIVLWQSLDFPVSSSFVHGYFTLLGGL